MSYSVSSSQPQRMPDQVARRDFRMPLVALGVWAACLTSIYSTWIVGVSIAAVAAVVCWQAGHHVMLQAVSTVAFGVVLGSLVTSIHVAGRDSEPLRSWVSEEKTGRAVVTLRERPRPLANNQDYLRARATLKLFSPGESTVHPPSGSMNKGDHLNNVPAKDQKGAGPGSPDKRTLKDREESEQAEGRWRVLIIAHRADWEQADNEDNALPSNSSHLRDADPGSQDLRPAKPGQADDQRPYRSGYLATAGDTIETNADLRSPGSGSLTSAVIFTRGPPEPLGETPWWQRWADSLHDNLHQATDGLTRDEAGLVAGLAVGDPSDMTSELVADFRTTGLAHLVATSGFHTNLVLGVVILIAMACRAGPKTQFVVALAALTAFVILVGPQPSVLRASALAAIVFLAFAFGRRSSGLTALAIAVTVLLLTAPYLAAELGFALSVSACVGLIVFAFRWARLLEHRGWPRSVAVGVTIPIAAQAAVTPLLVAIEGKISFVAIPVNILSTFVAAPAVMLSVLTIAVAAIWLPAGELMAEFAAVPVRWLIVLAETGALIPGGTIPWPQGTWWAIALALMVIALLIAVHVKALRGWIMLLAIIPLLIAPALWLRGPTIPEEMIIAMCDVGQGDAFILPGEGNGVIVVDVGPDDAAIDECLSNFGIRQIDLLIVSHFHMDHVGGISGALRGRNIDAVLVPPPADAHHGHELMTEVVGSRPEAEFNAVDEEMAPTGQADVELESNHLWNGPHHAEIVAAEEGQRFHLGDTKIEVIAPRGPQWFGTRSDSNNNSVVATAHTHGFSTLLTGDIEVEAQQDLLRSPHSLHSDVFKVPHHGSGYFDPTFFSAVDPTIAIIGVGEENSYGHPDPEVMTYFRDDHTLVKRSDHHGTVTLSAAESGRINVHSSAEPSS